MWSYKRVGGLIIQVSLGSQFRQVSLDPYREVN